MACFKPVPAVRLLNGDVRFISASLADCSDFKLPCGQCIGCRLEHSRQWAIRCMDESQMHRDNSFITLTFSPESVSKYGRSLDVGLFQNFMKRLRKEVDPLRVRFFIVESIRRRFLLTIMLCFLVLLSVIVGIGLLVSLASLYMFLRS